MAGGPYGKPPRGGGGRGRGHLATAHLGHVDNSRAAMARRARNSPFEGSLRGRVSADGFQSGHGVTHSPGEATVSARQWANGMRPRGWRGR
jgi:hypothetical protein